MCDLINMRDGAKQLLLLQMADSGFPTGGFSHSCGLEAALKRGIIANRDDLESFLICSLENAGSFSLPFIRDGHRSMGNVEHIKHLDSLCQASLNNHVANRASVRQGKSFLEVCQKSFQCLPIASLYTELDYCHYSVVYGAVCDALQINLTDTLLSFVFGVLRTMMTGAVRLGHIGPMEAQGIQHRLQQRCILDIIERNISRPVDEAAVSFPIVDTVQNTQDTLFAKLFYS